MRIALGSDERTHLTDYVEQELRRRGHQVEVLGPPAGQPLQWADLARAVAERLSSAEVDEGVLCCWTGTGVSMAANKVPGVRAALCADAQTARGARAWNDANLPPKAACVAPLRPWPGRSWTPGSPLHLTRAKPRTWTGSSSWIEITGHDSPPAPAEGEKGRV